jgi:serine/threonine protein kinase
MPGDLKTAVDRRLAQIRRDPEHLVRYDANGDGVIDDDEWAEVRRVVTAEVNTERQREQPREVCDQLQDELVELLEDRYELVAEIGRGGQGRTYLGRDQHTGEEVAVKELDLTQADTWKAIELFEREGEVLQSLSHPSIPAYVDAFHLAGADGRLERFFLVQQFVEGDSLDKLIDAGLHIDEQQARGFAAEMLEILSYLHGLAPPVIHRDIKPSNIIGQPDGSLALIDFGAVQSIVPGESGGSTIVGTSGYMPIEQLMGRAQPATDLYGLAATLVHLLSRRHPADLPVEAMALKFHDFVNVSEEFADFLEQMLAPYVEDRIQSAGEALEHVHGRRPPASKNATSAPSAANQQPARPVGIEFGRPGHEQQDMLSKLVHQASKQRVRSSGPFRHQAEMSDLALQAGPKPTERPAQMRSQVQRSDDALRLSVARPSLSGQYLSQLAFASIFMVVSVLASIGGAIVLGVVFGIIALGLFAYLYRDYQQVDITIDDENLHYVQQRPHGETSHHFDLSDVCSIDVDMHSGSSSKRRYKYKYRLLLQTDQKELPFGALLPKEELDYLAYTMHREIEQRLLRRGEDTVLDDQHEAREDDQERVETHQHRHA